MGVRAQRITLRIWEAQGKCCSICSGKMVPASIEHPTRGWTWDHVWPRARYGYCERGNILIAHVDCNGEKADRDPTERERQLLAKVNAALGYELRTVDEHVSYMRRFLSRRSDPNRLSWSDGVVGPSALALALEQATG